MSFFNTNKQYLKRVFSITLLYGLTQLKMSDEFEFQPAIRHFFETRFTDVSQHSKNISAVNLKWKSNFYIQKGFPHDE